MATNAESLRVVRFGFIGNKLSLAEINLFLAQAISHYEIELSECHIDEPEGIIAIRPNHRSP